jgi:hypothetical protein
MHVTILPEYSAERYFLLSEIEQKSLLYFFDEGLQKSLDDTRPSVLGIEVAFAYILIDQRKVDPLDWEQKIVTFVNKVRTCSMYPKTSTRLTIFVEIGIQNKSVFREVEAHIQRLFDSNSIQSLGASLFIGVSDSISACPSLEKCYDVLELSSPGYTDDMMQSIAILFAESRDDLKGLNPLQDPDAAVGVFQAFIAAEDNTFLKLVTSIKSSLIEKRPISSSTATNKKTKSFWDSTFLAFGVAIVAYLWVRYLKQYLKQ